MSTEIANLTNDQRITDKWAAGRLVEWAARGKENQGTREKLRRELDAYAAELAGPDAPPVEAMLAETAALSWFALRMHEAQYAAAVTSDGGMTLVQSEHAQRRIDRAHRRLMGTLRTLATVRRLAVPAIQVNVARRQVNQVITGTASGGS